MNELNYTITLKLHRPSKYKKEVIDEALLNYTKAYQHLLDYFFDRIDGIIGSCKNEQWKINTLSIRKLITKELDEKLNDFSVEPFKDSLKMDISASLAGYISTRRKDKKVGYPRAYIYQEEFDKEYKELLQKYTDENANQGTEDEIKYIIRKSENLRPLFFCRYSVNRNYSILYDAEKDRYYVKIYLMNVKNEKRKKLIKADGKQLIYLSKDKEIFREGRCKNTFLIFPLSFGKWQEKYLRMAIDNPGILKTARLTRNKGEYYLAINIEEEKPVRVDTNNFMGITRGIEHAVNYSIIDNKGNILAGGFQQPRQNSVTKGSLDNISNNLIALARKYKCQIIMESLISKGDFLTWIDKSGRVYKPLLGCQEYNVLSKSIEYNAARSGLPPTIRVSAVNIHFTCPVCGRTSKNNRFSSSLMICTSCGTSRSIDSIGSFNLANKLILYSKDTIKIRVENTPEGVRFINKDLELEYYPSDIFNCSEEFMEVIESLIKEFYVHIDNELHKKNFKKKLSLIKKIEKNRNIFELIEIN